MLPNLLLPLLTTKPLVCIKILKTLYVYLRISQPATYFFGIQDCCTWIFHVESQGQTLYTRILEHKPLVNTYYIVLELKYFQFAQFLLNAH